jgi:hypothetical protein
MGTVADGSAASHSSPMSSPCIATAATVSSQPAGTGSTDARAPPASAAGVIRMLTIGMATAFASGPTSDTAPKNQTPSGISDSVAAHWVRTAASRNRPTAFSP